jgi:alpha-L-rhamnosidase
MMVDMAEALGKKEDASRFAECREKVRNAFLREYVRPDGRITGGIQSSYAMPLGFGLLDHDPDLAGKAFSHLLEAIDAYDGHISTGVRATLPLLNVLSERGHHELAWKLVMQPDYPSYGFMVDQGATTVWERWDAFPDGRPQSDRSHIELPVVAGWITEKIAGIRPDPAAPGYKHFFIEPKLGGGLTWMKASYDSVRGRIESAYEIKGGKLTLRVTVPPNTTATATLPAASLETVTESGQALAKAAGVTVRDPANKLMELQAGQYEFVIPQ